MRVALIAEPGDRRASLGAAAFAGAGALVESIGWTDLAAPDFDLDRLRRPDLVRIDSTGESKAALTAVQRVGGAPAAVLDDPTLLGGSAAWFRGVAGLADVVAAARGGGRSPSVVPTPVAIRLLCDKGATQKVLRTAGVPVPDPVGDGPLDGWDDLLERLRGRSTRVFVKPCHGSAAAGAMAIAIAGRRVEAWTPTEVDRSDGTVRYRSSLRVGRLLGDDVGAMVDHLVPEGLHVERWMPKASTARGPIDLRVVVTDGRVTHQVVRQGTGPFTNLHLGGGRVEIDDVPSILTHAVRARIDRVAVAAYEAVASTVGAEAVGQVGVDVLVTTDGRVVVCEVNAFGDLLPGIVDDRGRSTHRALADLLVGRLRPRGGVAR